MNQKIDRVELYNNYINGYFNINHNEESNLDNTNKFFLNNRQSTLLNDKILNISQNSDNLNIKNNSFQLKNNFIINDDTFQINKNEWIKNRLKIIKNKYGKKIIYCLEQENDNILDKDINRLSAYKDRGLYIIYRYIDDKNSYEKEIKAKIKWNMLSNHFKIFDNSGKIIEEIIYNFNFKGMNGPTKLKILLPYHNKTITKRIIKNNNDLCVHKMENKSPEYNNFYRFYVLNFIKRKVIPNERNIQIIYSEPKEDENNILLQFAQVKNDEYILDYKYPFNNITALSLALTNLSSRMFCQ